MFVFFRKTLVVISLAALSIGPFAVANRTSRNPLTKGLIHWWK